MERKAARKKAHPLEGPAGRASIEAQVAQIACGMGVFVDLDLAAELTALRLLVARQLESSGSTLSSDETLLDAAHDGVEGALLDAESRLTAAATRATPGARISPTSPEALLAEGFQLAPEQALVRLVSFNQLPLPERRAVYDIFARKVPIEELLGTQREGGLWRDRESFKRSLLAGLAALYGEEERS
jgi:hypothetical protein